MIAPAFADPDATVYQGHVIDVLRELPEKSVQCCITSPPYYGLRSYQTPPQVWGGDESCEHEWGDEIPGDARGGSGPGRKNGSAMTYARALPKGNFCLRCHAWRGELGQEPTLALYLDHLVSVFEAVKRVLRDDGTLWVNIGDSYVSNGRQQVGRHDEHPDAIARRHERFGTGRPKALTGGNDRTWREADPGLKAKDLMLVPHRFAIAMCDAGWYVRSDIIWGKKSCMPESVTDRPTSAHEHIFLFAKQPRYFWDAEAVKEGAIKGAAGSTFTDGKTGVNGNGRVSTKERIESSGRNMRNVWMLGPENFPDAHFAAFPSEIPRRCILAGSRPGDTILDPFLGSGTTALVARQLGRRCVGIELQADYLGMIRKRLAQQSLMLTV